MPLSSRFRLLANYATAHSGLLWFLTGCACCVMLAITGLCWFQSAGPDDSYITYGAASNLLKTGRVTNYSGDDVEQSSSLLQVILVATVAWLTDLEVPLVGWASGIAAAFACVFGLRLLDGRADRSSSSLAMFLTGVCGYFAYWAFSGMETTLAALAALLWVAAHASYLSKPCWRSYCFSVLSAIAWALVRPEAPVLALAVLMVASAFSRAWGDRTRAWLALRLSVTNLSIVLLLGGWRLLRFGSTFPQPVYAKQGSLSLAQLLSGVSYVLQSTSLSVLAIAVFVATVRLIFLAWQRREVCPTELLAACFCGGLVGFSIAVGGDWMNGARFLCPALPLGCFVAARALESVGSRAVRRTGAVLLAGSLALGGPELARTGSTGVVAWAAIRGGDGDEQRSRPFFERRNRPHVRDVPVLRAMDLIVQRLVTAKRERTSIMTGQGGFVMYHTLEKYRGHVTVIDRRGLLDRTLTSSPTVRALGRDTCGLSRRYDLLFQSIDQIQREVPLPLPDVIYDLELEARERASIRAAGYVSVYEQRGWVRSSDAQFPGQLLSARQAIFVQRRYAEAVGVVHPLRSEF